MPSLWPLSCGHQIIGVKDATSHQGSGEGMPQPGEVARPPSAPPPCRQAANWASQSKRRLQLPAAPARRMLCHVINNIAKLLQALLNRYTVRYEQSTELQAAAVLHKDAAQMLLHYISIGMLICECVCHLLLLGRPSSTLLY